MLKNYELTYTIKSSTPEDELSILKEKVTRLITESGGHISEEKSLSNRSVSLKNSKRQRVTMIIMAITVSPDSIADIQSVLRISDHVVNQSIFEGASVIQPIMTPFEFSVPS